MTWVLVMYIYAGTFAKGDSVTISTIDGYTTQAICQQAGSQGAQLVGGSAKEYRFVCIPKK